MLRALCVALCACVAHAAGPTMKKLSKLGSCTGVGMGALAHFPASSQLGCQQSCLADPACVAAAMENSYNANCRLYQGLSNTISAVPSSDKTDTTQCYNKTDVPCTTAMVAQCRAAPRTNGASRAP